MPIQDSTDDRSLMRIGGCEKSERSLQKKPSAKGWPESLRTWRRTKSEHPVVAKTREVLELRRPGCAVPGQVARDFYCGTEFAQIQRGTRLSVWDSNGGVGLATETLML